MTLFKPAVREQIKLRAALDGPTGSGKTWTALQWARIIAGPNGLVGAVDSESGGKGILRYVPAPGEHVERINWWDPPYEVGHTSALPPYDPRDLAKLIDVAGDELGDDGVLLLDSLTHFWTGEGGTLDIVDDAMLRGANRFSAWQEGTPAQRFLLDRITSARCHVIVTMRSKMDYVMQEALDSKGAKRTTVEKVGMQPEQRPGIEYEFDVIASMDLDHRLIVSKTRIPGLADRVAQKGRSYEVAEVLAEWLQTGAQRVSPQQAAALTDAMASVKDDEARKVLKLEFVAEFGVPSEVLDYRAAEAAQWVTTRLAALQETPTNVRRCDGEHRGRCADPQCWHRTPPDDRTGELPPGYVVDGVHRCGATTETTGEPCLRRTAPGKRCAIHDTDPPVETEQAAALANGLDE